MLSFRFALFLLLLFSIIVTSLVCDFFQTHLSAYEKTDGKENTKNSQMHLRLKSRISEKHTYSMNIIYVTRFSRTCIIHERMTIYRVKLPRGVLHVCDFYFLFEVES